MPREKEVKTILNKSKRRDPWFLDDYTVNLYSGCSFNCLFCYIRGSKYGQHMERSLSVKSNALELLERQLSNRAKKGQYGIIALSSATDPYLHAERDFRFTRQALEIILKYRFPVHILTRSDLVLRDLDLIQAIDEAAILPEEIRKPLSRGAIVTFSFSTVDDAVARIFEPGATPPSQRLQAMSQTKDSGLLTGVSMMPMLPWISDTTQSLNEMLSAFQSCKVDYVLPATLTLFGSGPSDSRTLVMRAIGKHYPDLVSRYEQYFAEAGCVPDFYQKAFDLKMKELLAAYGLRSSILNFSEK